MISGNPFVTQKSQEISLALIKLSVRCRRQEFRQRLEKLAFDLAEAAGSGKFESAISVLSTVSHMMSLGKSIYEIEPINAMVVNEEVSGLLVEAQKMVGVMEPDMDISKTFSKLPSITVNQPNNSSNIPFNATTAIVAAKVGDNTPNILKRRRPSRPLNLQPSILSAIRQLGNPAMKDLIAALPNTKDRTLRYNLQKMVVSGLIIKSGNGPSCRYSAIAMVADGNV